MPTSTPHILSQGPVKEGNFKSFEDVSGDQFFKCDLNAEKIFKYRRRAKIEVEDIWTGCIDVQDDGQAAPDSSQRRSRLEITRGDLEDWTNQFAIVTIIRDLAYPETLGSFSLVRNTSYMAPVTVRFFLTQGESAATEAWAYTALRDLQGSELPWSYGFYKLRFRCDGDWNAVAIGHITEYIPGKTLHDYGWAHASYGYMSFLPELSLLKQLVQILKEIHQRTGLLYFGTDPKFRPHDHILLLPNQDSEVAINVIFQNFSSSTRIKGPISPETIASDTKALLETLTNSQIPFAKLSEVVGDSSYFGDIPVENYVEEFSF